MWTLEKEPPPFLGSHSRGVWRPTSDDCQTRVTLMAWYTLDPPFGETCLNEYCPRPLHSIHMSSRHILLSRAIYMIPKIKESHPISSLSQNNSTTKNNISSSTQKKVFFFNSKFVSYSAKIKRNCRNLCVTKCLFAKRIQKYILGRILWLNENNLSQNLS